MRSFRVLLCLLLVLPFAAFPATAQEDDAEARAFVLQAIANLTALPGYHFAYETRTTSTFSIFADNVETTLSTATITSVEGDAVANGDNFTTISIATGESLEAAEATPPLHVERTVFNGKSALNFQIEDTVYEDQLPFEDGGQAYDDARSSTENLNTQLVLDNVDNIQLPTALFYDISIDESLIKSVTELNTELFDDISLRVFDVELDALGLILKRTPIEDRGSLQNIWQDLLLLAGSDLSASDRLWVGMNDRQIYRAQFSYVTSIPYFSSGHEDMSPYDVVETSNTELILAQHGKVVEIEPVVFPD